MKGIKPLEVYLQHFRNNAKTKKSWHYSQKIVDLTVTVTTRRRRLTLRSIIKMKRIISLSLVTAFLCASSTALIAQRADNVKTQKTGALTVKPSAAGNRFGSVRAFTDGNGVLVEWQMSLETNNAGFVVYRLDSGGPEMVSPEIVRGAAANGAKSAAGEKYSFFDPEGNTGTAYFIQSVSVEGKMAVSPTVTAEYVTDLLMVGPTSSYDLNREALERKQRGLVTANRLEFPKTIYREIAENQTFADDNTHAWVVSQPGVKIGVKNEGFHRVTKAELQTGGFNVNADSSLWQLYREGVQQAITVGPNGDYIDFYGKGVDRPETDTATYFLVSGPSAGKRIGTKVARPFSGSVTSANYLQTFSQKQRKNYLSQVLNGEAENYWGDPILTGGNTTYNFNLSGVDFTRPSAVLDLKFQGFSFDQHVVQVTLNGEALASATGNSRAPFSKQYVVPTAYLREGANSIVFRSIGVTSDFSLFDSIGISFARKFTAAQNRLRFYTSNYRLSKLEGFSSSNVRVFDMTAESSPVMWTNLNVVQEGPTFSVRMPSDRGRSLVAVEDSALFAVASVTPNDPANLKVTTHAANLVIITHKNWMAQAQDWADYRLGQGISVKVVDVSEIYDEFNYGDLSSLSIRGFLNYAKNSWQTPPSYVLLIGDASFDARNYEGFGNNNLIPTHIVDTVFLETGSDESMADFNDDGLADMAIGRIPARTALTVTNVLAKVMAFEAAAPTLSNRGVLFASDCYDAGNNYDFHQISVRLGNQLPGGVPVTMVGRCDSPTPPATPQTLVIDAMNTGKLLVNYSGHGTTGAWASSTFFSNSTVPQLTNSNNLSVFTMLTCLNGYFLHASNKSLAESLLESTNGGAVAAWASSGETTPDVQEVMATRFFNQMGNGQLERLGDLINDAKTVIPGGTDVRLSWSLIGDPMLKVRSATTGDRPGKTER